MRKLLFIILIFSGTPGISSGQNVVFPLIKELKGNVKSVKEVQYAAVIKADKVVKGAEIKKSNYLLDTKNNLIEKDDYDSTGALIERYVTNYNANENPLEEMLYTPDSVISKFKYRYDSKNNRIGWMSFTRVDTAIARGSYHYDDKGRITSDSLFDGKGAFVKCNSYFFNGDQLEKESHFKRGDLGYNYTDTYEFDMDGNRIQDTKIGADGSTESVSRLKYNSDGKLSELDILTSDDDDKYKTAEKRQYDNNGRIVRLSKFWDRTEVEEYIKYDSAGNIVCDSNITVAGDMDVPTIKYKYCNNKDTLEKGYYSGDGTCYLKYSYKYDVKRNKIEKKIEKGKDISESLIEYDRPGNPVKEILYKNGRPVTIAEREFVYCQ